MKNLIKWAGCLLFGLTLLNGCDWKDLPLWDEAEISAVQFYYRWESDERDPVLPDEPVIYKQRMETTTVNRDPDNGVIEVRVTVPAADDNGDFTSSVRSRVSMNPLWGQVTVSTAARVTPIEGSAPLGTPDDWSVPRKFSVQAADGTTKTWTIKIVDFVK